MSIYRLHFSEPLAMPENEDLGSFLRELPREHLDRAERLEAGEYDLTPQPLADTRIDRLVVKEGGRQAVHHMVSTNVPYPGITTFNSQGARPSVRTGEGSTIIPDDAKMTVVARANSDIGGLSIWDIVFWIK